MITDIQFNLMVNGQVFIMAQLLQCLKTKFLARIDISNLCAEKLQRKFLERYDDSIKIITQYG